MDLWEISRVYTVNTNFYSIVMASHSFLKGNLLFYYHLLLLLLLQQ